MPSGGQQAGQEQLSPIEKLDKQDKRNKEIAREKTVEDTKKQILEVDMTETKFGADEEKMIYFFLLSSLRKEHFCRRWHRGRTFALSVQRGQGKYCGQSYPKGKSRHPQGFLD